MAKTNGKRKWDEKLISLQEKYCQKLECLFSVLLQSINIPCFYYNSTSQDISKHSHYKNDALEQGSHYSENWFEVFLKTTLTILLSSSRHFFPNFPNTNLWTFPPIFLKGGFKSEDTKELLHLQQLSWTKDLNLLPKAVMTYSNFLFRTVMFMLGDIKFFQYLLT